MGNLPFWTQDSVFPFHCTYMYLSDQEMYVHLHLVMVLLGLSEDNRNDTNQKHQNTAWAETRSQAKAAKPCMVRNEGWKS